MVVAQPAERHHPARGHAPDPEPIEIKQPLPGVRPPRVRQCFNDLVDLADHLCQHVESAVGVLERGVQSLAVPGEVDSARGDAGPDPAQVPSGVEFLVRRPPVHPQHRRRGAFPVRVRQHDRDRPEPHEPRTGREITRELGR